MPAELRCFDAQCGARYAITEVLYNCPKCGGLMEASYDFDADPAALKEIISRAAHEQRSAGRERRVALSRTVSVSRRFFAGGHAAGREHAAARCADRGAVRRARSNRVQASGIQSDRIVQRQRNDVRSGAGAAAGDEARGVRVHRQHVGVDGRLCGGGRTGGADFSAARKYFVRETCAGARIWREDV